MVMRRNIVHLSESDANPDVTPVQRASPPAPTPAKKTSRANFSGLSPAVQQYRQQALDFGAATDFQQVHGLHAGYVAIGQKHPAAAKPWTQRMVTHDDAAFAVDTLAGLPDCYISQNGYRSPRGRTVSNVSRITSAWIDFDYYNIPQLDGITPDELLRGVMVALPWMPMPTILQDSGRGAYFKWCFTQPLDASLLPQWQRMMDALVRLFDFAGADANAKDAARVLRVPGTLNSKTGRTVTARITGPRISFEAFRAAVLDAYQVHEQRIQLTPDTRPDAEAPTRKPSSASPKQQAQSLQPYQLALDRISDYHTLAQRRGPMTDYRHRLLFCFAASMVWYRSDVAGIEEELNTFAQEHFADARRYTAKRVQSVLDRLSETKAGVVAIHNGQRAPRRYRLSNSTIIAMLNISPDEQRQLKTIISADERNRRREERRRAKGMQPRAEYLATSEQRRARVLAMRKQGQTTAAIAAALGMTRQHVNRIIAAAQTDMFDE